MDRETKKEPEISHRPSLFFLLVDLRQSFGFQTQKLQSLSQNGHTLLQVTLIL